MPESKTKINLASKRTSVCEEWDKTPEQAVAFVTGNGAYIIAARQAVFAEAKHQPCFAHKNDVVASTALGLTSRNGDEDEPHPRMARKVTMMTRRAEPPSQQMELGSWSRQNPS